MGEVHRRAAALAAGALLLACSLSQVLAEAGLPGDWHTGIATNYGGAQDGMDPYQFSFGTSIGSCGYGKLDKSKFFWSVGALSTSNQYYQGGPVQGCGMCFEIECLQNAGQFAGRCNQDPNARMVTIMITDSCPECEPDHLDLQALTFNKVAPMSLGRIDMRYRRVECKPPSDMNVIVDQNRGSGGWIRLQVKDAAMRGSVKLVQIKGPNTGWETMNNVWGASWEATSVPDPPLDFRIQDDTGTEVTAFGVIKANGQTGVMPTGINFQLGSSQSTPSISSPASASSGSQAASTPKVSASASSSSGSDPKVSAFSGPSQSQAAVGGAPSGTAPAAANTPCTTSYNPDGSRAGTVCSNQPTTATPSAPPPPPSPPPPYWWQPPPPSL
ncbi:hypothetical protein WJX75_002830 [Coccomyxa subellipsoidea]|uniref:Expansin-like EG45 domain-containing protein n=1 Tax=Coccomyxa subellipsoidea TaxID=248742 RepID=A0ABR2YK37_9CHLO